MAVVVAVAGVALIRDTQARAVCSTTCDDSGFRDRELRCGNRRGPSAMRSSLQRFIAAMAHEQGVRMIAVTAGEPSAGRGIVASRDGRGRSVSDLVRST